MHTLWLPTTWKLICRNRATAIRWYSWLAELAFVSVLQRQLKAYGGVSDLRLRVMGEVDLQPAFNSAFTRQALTYGVLIP